MKKNSLLLGAALGGLMFAGASCGKPASDAPDSGAKAKADPGASGALGQCHGINECKGKGACHTKTHDCAGKNSCKGKAWLKMSKADCDAKKGTFKAG